MNILLAAISLGFLGSFHCIGMCGPIALAIPVNSASAAKRGGAAVLYNAGRISTYALLGGLFGLAGKGIALTGFQQALSVVLGSLILIGILLPNRISTRLKPIGFVYSFIAKFKKIFSSLFQKQTMRASYMTGLLNGLLPCGLVYLGIAGAMATGNAARGALFMAIFGAGTLPTMLFVSMLRNNISLNFRSKINRAMPLFISGMALLLILRGLNLGIPYISPQITADCHSVKSCCRVNK